MLDLSKYVRVGRYDLPEPTRTTAPAGSKLAQEVSAVTYNWDTDSLFVVGDGGTSIVQVSKSGQLISSMTLAAGSSPQGTAFYDPEGLTYIGNGQFVMTEERDRAAVKFTFTADTVLQRADTQTVDLGTFSDNIGLEGVSYDPLTGGFIFVKEVSPEGVFQTDIDFANGTATNGSSTTENSENLFDPALLGLSDIADVFALSNLPDFLGTTSEGNLLILSQEDGRIVEVDRDGNVVSSLQIQSDAGNPLSLANQQHEGITMDRNGFIYVVSENGGGDVDHPQVWVYAPSDAVNEAPTGISLSNALTAIAENSSTANRVKVADIVLTDDGLGTNVFTVTGADAAFFEADNTGLYIKAGTVIDFEAKQSYSVSVSVDDASVGATPDATIDFTLNVTDVANEGGTVNVFVSEVAPWASGNSPYGVDWFELTNGGTGAANIAGWKMDDNSNNFGNAVALNGVTSIGAGESVIFVEGDAAAAAAFISTWFGAAVPPGLQVGWYSGGGVGLSTGGDAVNIFNAAGERQAGVQFGASDGTSPYQTFDNTAGLNSTTLPLPTVTTLSQIGVNNAVAATNDAAEIGSPGSAGRIAITEVAPWSSGNSPVGVDWFEVTNTASYAIDMTGWKMDDNSQSPVAAVALNGIGLVNPGESVIFFETTDLAGTVQKFIDTWFGGVAPEGLRFGSYSGSGVGLSTGGDAVNLYDGANKLRASVSFGESPKGPYGTFDNSAGLDKVQITTLSSIGTNGAFNAVGDQLEIGSPGGKAIADYNPVVGTAAANNLFGATGSDALFGFGGDDYLKGGEGDDLLVGGAGNDRMNGDGGADTYLFRAADGVGNDRVYGFGADDRILTDTKIFDANNDGFITYGKNHKFDLGGGTNVLITKENGADVKILQYDGVVIDEATGQQFYAYSLVDSVGTFASGGSTMDMFLA